jgi:hypothetical protein
LVQEARERKLYRRQNMKNRELQRPLKEQHISKESNKRWILEIDAIEDFAQIVHVREKSKKKNIIFQEI